MNEIRVRSARITDEESMFQWTIDPELNRYDPKPMPKNEEEPSAARLVFHEHFTKEVLSDGKENYKYYMIADGDRLIGYVNLFSYCEEKGEIELGIMIGDRRFHGLSFASQALREVLKRIGEYRVLNRIRVETNVENLRAIRLFERAGFRKEEVEGWGDGVFFQIMMKGLEVE